MTENKAESDAQGLLDDIAPLFGEVMSTVVRHARKRPDKTYVQVVFDDDGQPVADIFYEIKDDFYRLGELDKASEDHKELAKFNESKDEINEVLMKTKVMTSLIPHEKLDGYRAVFDAKTENMGLALIHADPGETPVDELGAKWMKELSVKPENWEELLNKTGLHIDYVDDCLVVKF